MSIFINKNRTLLMIIFLALVFSINIHPTTDAIAFSYEQNTDRPGMDYKSFDLTAADYKLCMQACEKDSTCKAYTFVKPGIQGPNARCWLKKDVPDQKINNCCTSGVKSLAQQSDAKVSSSQTVIPKKPSSNLSTKQADAPRPSPPPGAMPNPLPPPGAMPNPLPPPGAMPDPLPNPNIMNKSHSSDYTIAQLTSAVNIEPNIDRPGKDYKNFDLPSSDPDLCRQACVDDPKCKAFTYVKPGIQGGYARCWLKSEVPPAKSNSCCISGVIERENLTGPTATTSKQRAPSAKGAMAQDNVDLPGMDYKNFDLNVPDPRLCQNACLDDPKCKAFTYVKPGFQGPNARCWLKDGVPQAKANNCCISGTKTSPEVTRPIAPVQSTKTQDSSKQPSKQLNSNIPIDRYKYYQEKVLQINIKNNNCFSYAEEANKLIQERIKIDNYLPKDDITWINDKNFHYSWCISHSKNETAFQNRLRRQWLWSYIHPPSDFKVLNKTIVSSPNPDDSDLTGFEISSVRLTY